MSRENIPYKNTLTSFAFQYPSLSLKRRYTFSRCKRLINSLPGASRVISVAHEAIVECVTDLTFSLIYFWTVARQNGVYLFYIVKRQIIQNFVCFHRNQVEHILSSFWQTRENSYLTNSFVCTKWSKFTGCCTNQHILIGSEKSPQLSNLNRAQSSVYMFSNARRVIHGLGFFIC